MNHPAGQAEHHDHDHAHDHRGHDCDHDHHEQTAGGSLLGWPVFLLVVLLTLVVLPPLSTVDGWQSRFLHSFLGLVLEAIPFLLIAGLAAGLIEVLVPGHWLPALGRRCGPLGLPLIALLTPLLPLCECGIVGIGRGLLRKGLPIPHCAVYLLAAPILNPIVLFTTWLAFNARPEVLSVVLARAAGGLLVPVVVGALLWRVRPEQVLLPDFYARGCDHSHTQTGGGFGATLLRIMDTARGEFTAMASWFVVGIAAAAGLKALVGDGLAGGDSGALQPAWMMLVAFGLSLCSEVDAFVAASFPGVGVAALAAFLVFGPMIDIRLLMLYRSLLKGRYVLAFAAIITAVNLIYAYALWGMLA